MQSYRRLSELAGHPVLSYLLTGLIQEESIHSKLLLECRQSETCGSKVFEGSGEVYHRSILEASGTGSKGGTTC